MVMMMAVFSSHLVVQLLFDTIRHAQNAVNHHQTNQQQLKLSKIELTLNKEAVE